MKSLFNKVSAIVGRRIDYYYSHRKVIGRCRHWDFTDKLLQIEKLRLLPLVPLDLDLYFSGVYLATLRLLK
jgi:hypothetical protein